MVVINPNDGNIVIAKTFDTYKTSANIDAFVKVSIPPGYIVAAACKDDCVTKLSLYAKYFFDKLGSKEIHHLEYRQGFAFLGVSGGSINDMKE